MITNRIRAFLTSQRLDGPCLVLDREVVREKYLSYARALPNTKIYYAVKANPHAAILELLVELGSSFDAAAIAQWLDEIEAQAGPDGRFWLVYTRPYHGDWNGSLLAYLKREKLVEFHSEFAGATLYRGQLPRH